MNHTYHKPHKELTAYVRTVLVMEGDSNPDASQLPAFTNGMSALYCKTEKSTTNFEHIIAVAVAHTIPADFWDMANSTTIIIYFFKPFALTSLFNISAKELIKNPIALNNWSPHTYNALKTQLVYADTITKKLDAFDNLLIQQHIKNEATYNIIQYATDEMMYNTSNDILTEILSKLNLNERTFQRIFKKFVGVTPTQYRRISQFQGSFAQLRSKQYEKISDVAFDNGFSDQSHFIRSFKEFTHTTPNDYLNNGLTDKK